METSGSHIIFFYAFRSLADYWKFFLYEFSVQPITSESRGSIICNKIYTLFQIIFG